MPVVDSDYWKPGRTMREVLSRLDSFVHQPPNVYSPANEKMLKLYLEDEQEYARTIREQVKRYTTIHQKYLEMPCVHVFFK
jgi:ubiquitin-protein ligase